VSSTAPCLESLLISFLPIGSEKVFETTQAMLENYEGSEVVTTAVMKNLIFWDKTLCKPLNVNRRFGGTYLHLVSPKRLSTFNGLHVVMCQKLGLLKIIILRAL
jgi:hypothetical protein